MRVLQVDSGRDWRGGQHQVWLLCRELARHGDVAQALVTKQGSELAQRATAAGIEVLGTTWDIGLDPRAWWRLRRTIAAFRPDIIHVHDSHSLALAATVASGRTMVATRRVEFRIGRFGAWRRPDRIIAVSEAVKRVLIADGIAQDAVVVIPDGIDVAAVRQAAQPPLDVRGELHIPASAPLAVNAAALTGEKDHRTLIRAAAHARATRPDLHWVIAGEGRLRESLTGEISRRGLSDRVHLIGHVDRVDALIAAATVFVLCSRSEGLGSVILNALALERPVVATAAGGVPEILPPEALVPVEAPEALAQRVIEVLDHPATIPLPPRFTAHAMGQGVLDVYRGLL
ncbi:MAG TPA: glycosyltransferase [Gemmatimonadales bacterium]|jgi:glycosyltransferase involved in cell wall biosynthesis